MSSTGRGPRLGGPDDFYITPAWCVNRFIEDHRDSWIGKTVEPAAGNGAIIEALCVSVDGFDAGNVTAIECRATARAELERTGATVVIDDFLSIETVDPEVDYVITNPPYSLAREFVEHSAKLYPNATRAFLVRLGFLASEERAAMFRDSRASVYVLPNRPSFTPDGKTDSADYCWLVFDEEERFCVLKTTSKKIRRAGK